MCSRRCVARWPGVPGCLQGRLRKTPGTYGAESYDAANFLLAGIAAGKQDRASLNDYLNTTEFKGITKTVKFDATGEVTATDVYIFQVKGGVIVGIGKA